MADHSDLGFVPDENDHSDLGFVPDAGGENAPLRVPSSVMTSGKVIPSPDVIVKPPSLGDRAKGATIGAIEGSPIGGIAKKTAAGLSALSDVPFSQKSFGENYNDYLGEYADDRDHAARKTPGSYATGKVASALGGALVIPSPAAYAGVAGTNAAVESDGDLADKAVAGINAAGVSYALGKLGQGIPGAAGLGKGSAMLPASFIPKMSSLTETLGKFASTASPKTLVGVGAASAARTALDPNVALGDKLAAVGDVAAQGASHVASGKARRATTLDEPRALAETDLRNQVNTQADAEGRRDARLIEGHDRAAQSDAEKLNQNIDSAVKSQVGVAKDEFNEGRAVDRRALADDNDELRAADDKQQRTYENAVAKKAVEDKKANDERRLSALAFKEAMNKYGEQKADADAYVQEEGALGKEKQARATRVRMVMAAADALRAAHTKEGESIRAKMEELKTRKADAAAGAQAYFDGLHRELYDRATRHIAGSEALGQEPDSDIVNSLRYLASKHESLSPAKFKQLDEYADPATHDEALRKETAKRAGETDAEMQGLSDRLNAESDPDFEAQARKKIAEKQAASDALDARAMAAVEAEGTGKPGLRLKPAEPVSPDTSERKQALIDFERNKIKNPPQPLPPKPDRLVTKGLIRDANADFRNAPGFVEPVIPRVPIADELAPGYMSAADRGPDSTPRQRADDVARRLLKARETGRKNLDTAITAAKVTDPKVKATPEDQFLHETRNKALSKVAHTALGTAIGSQAGPLGAAVGAYAGAKSHEPSPSVIAKYLMRGADKEGVERYSSPAEADALLEGVQKRLREKSLLSDKSNEKVASAAAVAAAIEALRKKHGKERR